MDLVAPVKQLFARLRGLVVEAVTERMRALPEGGTLDVEDVQARASASLAVLSVVDANFDTLSLPSMLMSRIQELPLQWPDISARLAEASAAGRFVEVEAIMLAVLRDARVDALIKASISDVEKCSEIILSDVSNSVSALLPVDKKDLVSVEPAFAASTSSTVFGLDDLMRMSDGPSFTDLEDLVAAVTRKDAKARHAALEALVQYPASDILHCQYFVAVKDAMLAALQESRMQLLALRYIQKLFSESLDVSPVQACELCTQFTLHLLTHCSLPATYEPSKPLSEQANLKFLMLQYRLLHEMLALLPRTWIYAPEPEVDRLYLTLFSLLCLGATSALSTELGPFALLSMAACTGPLTWCWAWCLQAKPRCQLFHLMMETGFLSAIVHIASRPRSTPSTSVQHACSTHAVYILCCVTRFADGLSLFPLATAPSVTLPVNHEVITAVICSVSGGCVPDAGTNNRLRRIAVQAPHRTTPSKRTTISTLVSLLLAQLQVSSPVIQDAGLAVASLMQCQHVSIADTRIITDTISTLFLKSLKGVASYEDNVTADMLAAHATALGSIIRHQFMHWTVADVDCNISTYVDVLSLVLEVLFSPADRPFAIDISCLQALLHDVLGVLALPSVMFALFYSHPCALEALTLACAGASASTPASLVLLDGVARACETPLGLLWLHNSNLLDTVSTRLCARHLAASSFSNQERSWLRIFSSFPGVVNAISDSGLLALYLRRMSLLIQDTDTPHGLHCPDSENLVVASVLQPLQALMLSPSFVMALAGESSSPPMQELSQLLLAVLAPISTTRLVAEEEVSLIVYRLLSAACIALPSVACLQGQWRVVEQLLTWLAPLTPLVVYGMPLPEGFEHVVTSSQPASAESIKPSARGVSADLAAVTDLLIDASVLGGSCERTAYHLSLANDCAICSLPTNITEISAFAYQEVDPIELRCSGGCGSQALHKLLASCSNLEDIGVAVADSVISMLRSCSSATTDHAGLFQSVVVTGLQALCESHAVLTGPPLTTPPSVKSMFSNYFQRIQTMYPHMLMKVDQHELLSECETDLTEPVDWLCPMVGLVCGEAVTARRLRAFLSKPLPVTSSAHTRWLYHIWKTSCQARADASTCSQLSCFLHCVDTLLLALHPASRALLLSAGVVPHDAVLSWFSQGFLNVLNAPDIILMWLVLPLISVDLFAFACAHLLHVLASSVQDCVICCDGPVTVSRAVMKLPRVNWQVLVNAYVEALPSLSSLITRILASCDRG